MELTRLAMPLIRVALSASGMLEIVLSAVVVAELAGYWLHRLLHSEKLPLLSRSHMIHHLAIYGPSQSMRTQTYKDATPGRPALGNVGLEWLAPSAIVLAFCWLAMALLRVPAVYQALAIGTLIAWPCIVFSYLHDRMHLKEFWMTRCPLFKPWFVRARRLHDIHHRSVNDEGRMDTNFGIAFHMFDRVFRTLSVRHRPLNRKGFENALSRYTFPSLQPTSSFTGTSTDHDSGISGRDDEPFST
jgi:sterol desaturase/sphingolipid hydroxylase (fatty acid hydroxylase superfamily)